MTEEQAKNLEAARARARLIEASITPRAIDATNALGITDAPRRAIRELAISHDYEEAARKAGVTSEIVREWTKSPNFVMALGWFVVGLADNHE